MAYHIARESKNIKNLVLLQSFKRRYISQEAQPMSEDDIGGTSLVVQ